MNPQGAVDSSTMQTKNSLVHTLPSYSLLAHIASSVPRTPSPDSACERDWAPSTGQSSKLTTSSDLFHSSSSCDGERDVVKDVLLHPGAALHTAEQTSTHVAGSRQQDSDEDSGILTSEACSFNNDTDSVAEKASFLLKVQEGRDQKDHLGNELHSQALKPSLKKSASCASEASSLNIFGTDSRCHRKKAAQLSQCNQFSSLQRVRFDDELPLSEQSIRKSCRQLYAALYTQKENSSAAVAQQKSESCCNLLTTNHSEKGKLSLPPLKTSLPSAPYQQAHFNSHNGGSNKDKPKLLEGNLSTEGFKEKASCVTDSVCHTNSSTRNLQGFANSREQKPGISSQALRENTTTNNPQCAYQSTLPVSAVLKKSTFKPVIYKSSSIEGSIFQQSSIFKNQHVISAQQDTDAGNGSRKRSISCNILGCKPDGITSQRNDIIKVQARLASVIPDSKSHSLMENSLPCPASSVKSLHSNNNTSHEDPISEWARGLCISTDSVFYSDEKSRIPPFMGPVSAVSDIHLHAHNFPSGLYESVDYMKLDSKNDSHSGSINSQRITKPFLKAEDSIYDEPKSLLPTKNMHKSDSAIHQPKLTVAKMSFLYCVQSLARSVRHTFCQAFGGEKAYHPRESDKPSPGSRPRISLINRLRRSMSLRTEKKVKKSTAVSKSHSLNRSKNGHCPPARVSGQLIQLNPDRSQVVELTRPPDQPFGFYLAKGKLHNSSGFFVSRMKDKETQSLLSGLLAVGDEVLQIDGKAIHNVDIMEVTKLMSEKVAVHLTVLPHMG